MTVLPSEIIDFSKVNVSIRLSCNPVFLLFYMRENRTSIVLTRPPGKGLCTSLCYGDAILNESFQDKSLGNANQT